VSLRIASNLAEAIGVNAMMNEGQVAGAPNRVEPPLCADGKVGPAWSTPGDQRFASLFVQPISNA
jgi:hypothetical protein